MNLAKDGPHRLFVYSEDKQSLEITHWGKVKVMDLYNKNSMALHRGLLPQELRTLKELIEEVEHSRTRALQEAADEQVQRAAQPRGTRSKTKGKAKG